MKIKCHLCQATFNVFKGACRHCYGDRIPTHPMNSVIDAQVAIYTFCKEQGLQLKAGPGQMSCDSADLAIYTLPFTVTVPVSFEGM